MGSQRNESDVTRCNGVLASEVRGPAGMFALSERRRVPKNETETVRESGVAETRWGSRGRRKCERRGYDRLRRIELNLAFPTIILFSLTGSTNELIPFDP